MVRGSGNKSTETRKKGGSNAVAGENDAKREAPLQAIVLADSFSEKFRPISLNKPKVLFPLANIPLLDYTLEFLASSGVAHVILFCTTHSEQIEEYIKAACPVTERVDVECVVSPTCVTAGDALREIDRLHLIQSDVFVLVTGDVVANVNLKPLIEEHKQRKKADSSVMMTSLFKQVQPNQKYATYGSIAPLTEELVVAINAETSQIVAYENNPMKRSLTLPTEFLKEHPQLAIRSDLMDCYIDICSPEVLLKFAEDFDYQHLRQDFYHNEVQNLELGNKFFVKVIHDEFAARVMDARTYFGITRAVLQRWVFPLVPDSNLLGPKNSNYHYHRGMVYKDATNLKIARSCEIQRESMLASCSCFGDKTKIKRSVIGPNCRIGNNVTIERSVLWGNIVVEDHVKISDALICDGVVIKHGAKIAEGVILDFNVVIGANIELKPWTKITKAMPVELDDSFSDNELDEHPSDDNTSNGKSSRKSESSEWKAEIVGKDGIGRLWTLEEDNFDIDLDSDCEDSDNEAMLDAKRLEGRQCVSMGKSSMIQKHADMWETWDPLSSSEDEADENFLTRDVLDDEIVQEAVPFQRIIHEMVLGGDADGHAVDDVFMEIKSFKFAQNRSFAEVLEGILPALLDIVSRGIEASSSAMVILAKTKEKFQKWSTVIERCLVDSNDRKAVINALLSYCIVPENKSQWAPLFRFLLQITYDLEWVMDDSILEWHRNVKQNSDQNNDSGLIELVNSPQVVEFIDWLQEDESDEEGDSSDKESD